jgi:hypothetical protein
VKRLLIGGLAALALGTASMAGASPDLDCFTQETYNGSRTTCYTGYPDYDRIITECSSGRCKTNVY